MDTDELEKQKITIMLQLSGLLPCPFCGEAPHEGGNALGQHVAKCWDCGIEMSHDRADKLEEMWNRRHKAND